MKYKIVPSNECPDTVENSEKNDIHYLFLIILNPFCDEAKPFVDELNEEFGSNSKSYLKIRHCLSRANPGTVQV